MVLHVLADGEVLVQGDVLLGDADVAPGRDVVRGGVVPGDEDLPRGRTLNRGYGAYGRGLAGPVGSEEAEDLALADIECQTVDGGEVAEADDEVADLRDDLIGQERRLLEKVRWLAVVRYMS